MKRQLGFLLAGVAGTGLVASAFAQNVATPYGTHHGDLFGTNRIGTTSGDWSNGLQLAWELDIRGDAANIDRPVGRSPMTFDSEGNIYWPTSIGGGTGGDQYIASVAPDGTVRWRSADALNIGVDSFYQSAVVVGDNDVVYSPGGGVPADYDGDGVDGQLLLAASTADGSTVWSVDMDGDWNNDGTAENDLSGLPGGGPPTPVLKDGVLIVTLLGNAGLTVLQFDAGDGSLLAADLVDPSVTPAGREVEGNQVYIDDVFGADLDGLFFNLEFDGNLFGDANSVRDVFGVQVDLGVSASLVWAAPGGKAARASMTYSPTTGWLYAHTWNDDPVVDGEIGASLTSYDPATGAIGGFANPGFGHGFYDVGILTPDGDQLFVGGFDGRLAAYDLNGDGTFGDPILSYFGTNWHGEYRTFGNLAIDPEGRPLVFTGTNSRVNDLGPEFTARMVVLDISAENLIVARDDAPMYVDDVEILAGATPETASVVYSETFEDDGPGTAVSSVVDPAGGSWANNSSANEPEPETATNPFQEGANTSSTVLVLDPKPRDDASNAAATWTFADEVGVPFDELLDPNDPGRYVILRWKQYRPTLTENVFISHDHDFAFQWDIEQRIRGQEFSEDTLAPLTSDKWETVELVYDFFEDAVTVFVDGVTDTEVAPLFIEDFGVAHTFIEFSVSHTSLDEGQPPLAQYDTGQAADNGFTLRGGPVVGPDGKFYAFKQDGPLLALEPATPTTIVGDSNCDGVVDFFDIDPFVTALVSGQAAWEASFDCDFVIANDIDENGVVDFFDIDPFVSLLVGS